MIFRPGKHVMILKIRQRCGVDNTVYGTRDKPGHTQEGASARDNSERFLCCQVLLVERGWLVNWYDEWGRLVYVR